MRTGKGNQDDEEYGEEEFGPRREVSSSNAPTTTTLNRNNNNNNGTTNKDAKNNDRASAIRSKHSVTEQRRRSKINERFQILREFIPHSDQKRDTASFLVEVIEYVQHLQEKIQKYEDSYPGWSPEPTKLMPWRNSHLRIQSFASHPQAIAGKFVENSITITPAIITSTPNPFESDLTRDVAIKAMERQPELESKGLPLSMPLQQNTHLSVRGAQPTECAATSDALGPQEDPVIEGGSISSVYSEELLSSLTQALQKAGIVLSQAKVSVQIDLGKPANQGLTSGKATAKDSQNPSSGYQVLIHPNDTNCVDESDRSHKPIKT